jgi:7-keto-8-aminopelargonate synthetase-like enzyme
MPPDRDDVLAGRIVSGPASARLRVDRRDYVNFFGSGYLALSNVPEIRSAVLTALSEGAPFARPMSAILGARDPIFDTVERVAGSACGTEASVYFASGYLIGIVGLASFEHTFDLLALDESAHYSLRDAAKITGIPSFTFQHCDVDSLSDVLKKHVGPRQRPLVVTDGAYATTGRIPPLTAYAALLAPYDGRLFVDDAHAFGVIGDNGRGAAEFCGVEHIAATGSTLSKAFCAQGAVVGCSAGAAWRLRSLPAIRGACAGSPLSAVAATTSLEYVAARPDLRKNLRVMTDYFRSRIRSIGLNVIDSPAPIVSFKFGNQQNMRDLQRRLFERGIYIYHSTYIGAGPEGTIRCAVFRDHSKEDIDALVDAISSA